MTGPAGTGLSARIKKGEAIKILFGVLVAVTMGAVIRAVAIEKGLFGALVTTAICGGVLILAIADHEDWI